MFKNIDLEASKRIKNDHFVDALETGESGDDVKS